MKIYWRRIRAASKTEKILSTPRLCWWWTETRMYGFW